MFLLFCWFLRCFNISTHEGSSLLIAHTRLCTVSGSGSFHQTSTCTPVLLHPTTQPSPTPKQTQDHIWKWTRFDMNKPDLVYSHCRDKSDPILLVFVHIFALFAVTRPLFLECVDFLRVWNPDGLHTCLGWPHVCRCVVGQDVDVVFEVLQQLVKLLLTAAAVSKDLHLVRDSLRHPRLDVVQVHSPLLRRRRREVKRKSVKGGRRTSTVQEERRRVRKREEEWRGRRRWIRNQRKDMKGWKRRRR